MKKERKKISISTKNALKAQLFILPFYLGFIFFFLSPLKESLMMSFSSISVELTGYERLYTGLENYNTAFFIDSDFTTNLFKTVVELFWKAPLILILALVLAMILNQKFKGRLLIRAIFFMPVIFASGIALRMIQGDFIASSVLTGGAISAGEISHSAALENLLVNAGFGTEIVDLATKISDNLFAMVWRSGIQMIIFLAGLQSIPAYLYEASSIEGASAWENFWKITLPMLSPIIIVNLVYTVVDNFTDSTNNVMMQIINLSSRQINKLGLAAAFSWVYFALIGIILIAAFLIFKRFSAADDLY